jgi:hypothetical protein
MFATSRSAICVARSRMDASSGAAVSIPDRL